jgi:hypothetical protein
MLELELVFLSIHLWRVIEYDADSVTVRHDLEVPLACSDRRAAEDESRRRGAVLGDVGRQRECKRPANGRRDVADEPLDGVQYLPLGGFSLRFSLRGLWRNGRD